MAAGSDRKINLKSYTCQISLVMTATCFVLSRLLSTFNGLCYNFHEINFKVEIFVDFVMFTHMTITDKVKDEVIFVVCNVILTSCLVLMIFSSE
jgi:hypothetical protein